MQTPKVQMMGVPSINGLQQLSVSKVYQEPSKPIKRRTRPVSKEDPAGEYSRANPHPKYNDVPTEHPQPVSTYPNLQPKKEWFQYGIGTNATPDKTPAEIEADRRDMNQRVKGALWGLWNTFLYSNDRRYYNVTGNDTNIDGRIE